METVTKISLKQKAGLPPPECKYHRKNNSEISWGSEVRIPCTYAAAATFPYLKKYLLILDLPAITQEYGGTEALWPSGQSAGLVICRSQVQVLL